MEWTFGGFCSGSKLSKKLTLKFIPNSIYVCILWTIFQFLADNYAMLTIRMDDAMNFPCSTIAKYNIIDLFFFQQRFRVCANVTVPPIKTFWRKNSSHLSNWHFWDRLEKRTRFCNTARSKCYIAMHAIISFISTTFLSYFSTRVVINIFKYSNVIVNIF